MDTGAHRELHQVKRSHPNGKWSLAALRGDGLLAAISRQLSDNDDRFVFVSGSSASELSALCEAAAGAEAVEEFKRAFLAARGRKADFEKLRNCWGCDVPTAIELLRRIDVRTIDERDLEDKVRWGVQALFLANPNGVVAALRGIVEDAVHRTIKRQELVDALAGRGYRLRRPTSPASARIRGRRGHQSISAGRTPETHSAKAVPAGRHSEAAGPLGRNVDRHRTDREGRLRKDRVRRGGRRRTPSARRPGAGVPTRSSGCRHRRPQISGSVLELEESPALVLAAAAEAAKRPGVLIVDQLDAVSTMSGRTSGALDLVEQLFLEARGSRPRAVLHNIVVCREFDWENDARLRRLMPSDADGTERQGRRHRLPG